MKLRIFFACICLLVTGCNTQYRIIVSSIRSLPPAKLLPKSQQGNTILTSKIDSISQLDVTSQERFDFILNLDNELKNRFIEYRNNKSKENFIKVVNRLNEISVDKDITFDVKIRTRKPGAVVKYRIEAQNEELIAHNLTNDCSITLYIGNYYIWTERSDKRTSMPRKYFLTKKDSITIPEKLKN